MLILKHPLIQKEINCHIDNEKSIYPITYSERDVLYLLYLLKQMSLTSNSCFIDLKRGDIRAKTLITSLSEQRSIDISFYEKDYSEVQLFLKDTKELNIKILSILSKIFFFYEMPLIVFSSTSTLEVKKYLIKNRLDFRSLSLGHIINFVLYRGIEEDVLWILNNSTNNPDSPSIKTG